MLQPIATPRIIRVVQDALEVDHALLTVPGGYGKSVTLRQLAAHRPGTYVVARPAPLTP